MPLMFRKQDRARVAAGEITVTYRLWARANVSAGKRYQTGFGMVEVLTVDALPAALVPERDVAPSGCADVAAIWALAGEHTKARVGPDTVLHRIEFRFIGEEPL